MAKNKPVYISENEGYSLSDRLRVAVGRTFDSVLSDEWVFWGSKNRDDFYATSASMRNELKLSVHDQIATFGFTDQAFATSPHAKGYQARTWYKVQLAPIESQVICQIRIACDDRDRSRQVLGRNLSLIDPPDENSLIQLQVILHRGERALTWREGATMVGFIRNKKNERLVILAEHASDPTNSVAEAVKKARLDTPAMTVRDHGECDRVVLFGHTRNGLFQITEVGTGRYARWDADGSPPPKNRHLTLRAASL